MNFGGDAVIHGENVVTTALVEGGDKTFYFVTLQGVSVGNQRINANAGRGGNMFIDSGTTVSLVENSVWKRMGDLISEAVGLPHRLDPGGTFMCYEAGGLRERFPDITFHFAGGADVVLKPTNAFTEPTAEGTVCLAMQATNGTGIMGNLAQHNFHIGYDLVGRKVAFKPTDCSSHLGVLS
ncbi:hypothetical protein HPP92_002133 [Vanilla planifolia]|nr:hypothetical protein HPP92_002133 [Vanilla planifolia]